MQLLLVGWLENPLAWAGVPPYTPRLKAVLRLVCFAFNCGAASALLPGTTAKVACILLAMAALLAAAAVLFYPQDDVRRCETRSRDDDIQALQGLRRHVQPAGGAQPPPEAVDLVGPLVAAAARQLTATIDEAVEMRRAFG